MLTEALRGVPQPIETDAPELDWEWTPHQGDGPASPWGGPSRRPERPVRWIPDTGVPTDCFTVELWLRPAQPLLDEDVPIVVTACNQRGTAWTFGLTRHLKPELRWLDRAGTSRTVLGDSLIDLLDPAGWLHLAIVHHGDGGDPAQAAVEYARWSLYVTPAGEAWPRLMVHEAGAHTAMPAASGCLHLMPGPFALAQAACFAHAKLPNEFATLGQNPPADVLLDDDFPGGSCRAPVALGPRRVVVGCGADATDANYWHHSRMTLPDPADRTPVELTLLAAPQGQGMLNGLFRSLDGERWERLPGAWYATDRRHAAQGFLRVSVPVEAETCYLAAAPVYGPARVERLLADLAGDPRATPVQVGQTTEQRPIRGLVLTDPAVPAERKDFLYLQAGQHSPMEQATGFVLDSLARELLDDSHAALLATHEVHLTPLVNVDSAALGSAGLTARRLNSNRYWLGRSIPETEGIRRHLDGLAARPGRMRLALDLHAGGGWPHHVTLYLAGDRAAAICPPGWAADMDRWLAVLEEHTGIARADALPTPEGLVHFSTAMAARHGWVASTLEFSFFTWRDLDGCVKPVTQDSLERCGRRLAAALTAFVSS